MADPGLNTTYSKFERRLIIFLMTANVLVTPIFVAYFSTRVSNELALAQIELAGKTSEISALEIEDRRLSRDAQQSIIFANSITARDSVLEVIERTIPTLDTNISVSANNNRIDGLFTIVNDSKVHVVCERPIVGLHSNRAVDPATNPNLFDELPLVVGILAPGAEYRTTWSTGELLDHWFNLSVDCRPLDFRVSEVLRMAAEAGIDIDSTVFDFSRSIWSKARP